MGVGETSIAVLLTADRLSAELHLSEMMAKPFRSFKKSPGKKIYPPLDGYSLCTKLSNSCLLAVMGLGTEKNLSLKELYSHKQELRSWSRN